MRSIRPAGARRPLWGRWHVALPLGVLVLSLLLATARALRRSLPNEAGKQESAAPQRIITIAPNSAEIICALGACDRIIGVSKFCVHPSELAQRPRVGGLFDPDLERIMALRPDLVVLRGRSESLEQLCRAHSIAVYHDKTDTLAGVETCVTELGRRLGLTEAAARLVARFRQRIDAIRRRTAGLPRPRVLLTLSRRPERLSNLLTAGRGTFLDEMLDIAGGANVFGHLDMRYPQVSPESIVAHRPDVILELMPEVALTPALRKQMLDQWRKLRLIPAVEHGRIHFVTDDHCLIPSLRYPEIMEKVSRLLHPELPVDP